VVTSCSMRTISSTVPALASSARTRSTLARWVAIRLSRSTTRSVTSSADCSRETTSPSADSSSSAWSNRSEGMCSASVADASRTDSRPAYPPSVAAMSRARSTVSRTSPVDNSRSAVRTSVRSTPGWLTSRSPTAPGFSFCGVGADSYASPAPPASRAASGATATLCPESLPVHAVTRPAASPTISAAPTSLPFMCPPVSSDAGRTEERCEPVDRAVVTSRSTG
jgi:hypothetical protein